MKKIKRNTEKIYCKYCMYFGHSLIAGLIDDKRIGGEICRYNKEYKDFYDERRKVYAYPHIRNKNNNCKYFQTGTYDFTRA